MRHFEQFWRAPFCPDEYHWIEIDGKERQVLYLVETWDPKNVFTKETMDSFTHVHVVRDYR